jgi:glucose dehydrogenase
MPATSTEREAGRPASRRWILLLIAALLGIAGLGLAGGGILLLTLGGSFYYAIAGLVMFACAVLLVKRSPLALLL